ncbi:MAG: Ribonuclease [Candidatus Parcubacteria bacterium]|jgi:ribonuclease P protein component
MITRSARIPRSDFPSLSRSRHHIHGEYHTVVYTPLEVYRGAVVVSKKVAKSAVDRNRLRRRAYATVATLWQTNELPTGAYIIYYKPGALKVSRKELAMSLTTTLARIPKSR